MTQARQRWLSILSGGLFFGAWEGICAAGWVSPVLLSPPSRVASQAVVLAGQGTLWADLAHTLQAFVLALTIATVGGALLGGLVGYSRAAYAVFNPFVVAINALPKVVLMPLVVLWVGIGTAASVLLGAVMASFPIITATFAGIQALERDFVKLARSFGARRAIMVRTIVLPGVLPYLLGGLRVGLNYAMVGVLIAEFFGASEGIGYRMMLLMANFEVAAFFVYLLVVATFTLAATAGLHLLERRLGGWRPNAFEPTRGM